MVQVLVWSLIEHLNIRSTIVDLGMSEEGTTLIRAASEASKLLLPLSGATGFAVSQERKRCLVLQWIVLYEANDSEGRNKCTADKLRDDCVPTDIEDHAMLAPPVLKRTSCIVARTNQTERCLQELDVPTHVQCRKQVDGLCMVCGRHSTTSPAFAVARQLQTGLFISYYFFYPRFVPHVRVFD